MKRFLPTLAIALAAVLTLFSGMIQGHLNHRWGMSPDARAAVAVLDQIPHEFGKWRLETGGEKLSDVVKNILQCEGYLSNRYVNEAGDQVSVAVLLGPPGPISVHTPEVCYSSREFDQVEDRVRTPVESDGHAGSFWRTTFRSRKIDGSWMSVYYAWSDGGAWTASESPRFEFAGQPYLFKLQMAGHPNEDPRSTGSDPCVSFLNDFVPVWDKSVSSLRFAP
jgi:hypothetical protein